MLVQFGNNWIQKIPLTAKLDSACGLVQFWLSSEFFSSNYFQIGQHVVLLHILIKSFFDGLIHKDEKVASSDKNTYFKARVQKPYLSYEQNSKC